LGTPPTAAIEKDMKDPVKMNEVYKFRIERLNGIGNGISFDWTPPFGRSPSAKASDSTPFEKT
jgi:hypothetical protein